MYWWN